MIDEIRKILIENSKFIVQLGFSLFVLYWFFYFMTPKINLSDVDSQKLKDLDKKMGILIAEQEDVDKNITKFNEELFVLEDSILQLKKQRGIIQNIYEEKDRIINNFDDIQLDSFFTERYGYSQSDGISFTDSKTNRK